jgi:hypothetical protein
MAEERAICGICFGEYIAKNERDHQCPDTFCCGACGEIVDHEEGESIMNEGMPEFVHKADLCSANDED